MLDTSSKFAPLSNHMADKADSFFESCIPSRLDDFE